MQIIYARCAFDFELPAFDSRTRRVAEDIRGMAVEFDISFRRLSKKAKIRGPLRSIMAYPFEMDISQPHYKSFAVFAPLPAGAMARGGQAGLRDASLSHMQNLTDETKQI